MSSESEVNERIANSNWLSRISAKFGDKPLKYYVPLKQEIPTELDGYSGRFSKQEDFLYFKNMMKMEYYGEKKTSAE
jgi:hypothetical protein